MSKFLKQPLLHFFLAGALVFGLYALQSEPVEVVSDDTIVVDRDALLNFLQFRARAFETELFSARLDAMSKDEKAALIQDYVREEVLYREALKMQMDVGDYIIRQRLVQKVEFLLENLVAENLNPAPGELEEFYQERLEDYQLDAVYTFTHIFFDAEEHGAEVAEQMAANLLADSNDIAFSESSQYGDRYPFLQNYVERTRDFVANNFSAEFVAELDQLTPGTGQWYGPLASRYGYHLVMLTGRSEPRVPQLSEIEARVMDDFRYETLLKNKQEAEDRVVEDYNVEVVL